MARLIERLAVLRSRIRRVLLRIRGHHRDRNRNPVLRGLRIGFGVLLILTSPLAVFVPLVAGPVMVIAGLSLLSVESRFARNLKVWLKLRLRTLKLAWRRRRI